VIWGENGSGKTSVLEAIHTLSLGKSFRTHRQKTLIKNGEDGFLIKGHFLSKKKENVIATQLIKKGPQQTKINGKKITTRKSLIGKNNVVLLSPEEQSITKGGPLERRRFFDKLFSVTSFYYMDVLQKYNRALKQRNAALLSVATKQGSKEVFVGWDEKLSEYGSKLWKNRLLLMGEFRLEIRSAVNRYKGELNLDLEYNPPEISDKKYIEKLLENRDKDIKHKTTTFGPHRDSVLVTLNNKDLRPFGSQGEHKIALVILKIAEVLFIKNKTGEYPMLLLDDVFAKLDLTRSKKLVRLINNLEADSGDQLQTIVTTTDIIDIKKSGMFDLDRETTTHRLKRKCST
tara:strand:- start:1909 stop:2943 length:1035 start_codon:yes stop_codon:yes gene_type:complete